MNNGYNPDAWFITEAEYLALPWEKRKYVRRESQRLVKWLEDRKTQAERRHAETLAEARKRRERVLTPARRDVETAMSHYPTDWTVQGYRNVYGDWVRYAPVI